MVDGYINNTIVNLVLNANSSVTVPTGETWEVRIEGHLSSGGAVFYINGNQTEGGSLSTDMILEGGTKIEISGGDSSTNLAVTGVKVKE